MTRLTAQTLAGLFAPGRTTQVLAREMHWQLQTLDGPGPRARYLLLRVLVPSRWDWASLSLTPAIYSLYYLARPPRLLIKYVGRLVRRGAGRTAKRKGPG